jgi:hypothetical protein
MILYVSTIANYVRIDIRIWEDMYGYYIHVSQYMYVVIWYTWIA